MEREQVAKAVAVERIALADLLDSLSPDQLATPSLCRGWTVHHVAAHLTTLWHVSLPSMTWRIARARGSFPKAVEAVTNDLARKPIAELSASLRANASNAKHPPTVPWAPLTDIIVHGDDIRIPLGIHRDVPPESLKAALEFVTSGRDRGTFIPRGRLHGLHLRAPDIGWTWGRGAEIQGPAQSLLLAVMGRRVALDDLSGATTVLDARL